MALFKKLALELYSEDLGKICEQGRENVSWFEMLRGKIPLQNQQTWQRLLSALYLLARTDPDCLPEHIKQVAKMVTAGKETPEFQIYKQLTIKLQAQLGRLCDMAAAEKESDHIVAVHRRVLQMSCLSFKDAVKEEPAEGALAASPPAEEEAAPPDVRRTEVIYLEPELLPLLGDLAALTTLPIAAEEPGPGSAMAKIFLGPAREEVVREEAGRLRAEIRQLAAEPPPPAMMAQPVSSFTEDDQVKEESDEELGQPPRRVPMPSPPSASEGDTRVPRTPPLGCSPQTPPRRRGSSMGALTPHRVLPAAMLQRAFSTVKREDPACASSGPIALQLALVPCKQEGPQLGPQLVQSPQLVQATQLVQGSQLALVSPADARLVAPGLQDLPPRPALLPCKRPLEESTPAWLAAAAAPAKPALAQRAPAQPQTRAGALAQALATAVARSRSVATPAPPAAPAAPTLPPAQTPRPAYVTPRPSTPRPAWSNRVAPGPPPCKMQRVVGPAVPPGAVALPVRPC